MTLALGAAPEANFAMGTAPEGLHYSQLMMVDRFVSVAFWHSFSSQIFAVVIDHTNPLAPSLGALTQLAGSPRKSQDAVTGAVLGAPIGGALGAGGDVVFFAGNTRGFGPFNTAFVSSWSCDPGALTLTHISTVDLPGGGSGPGNPPIIVPVNSTRAFVLDTNSSFDLRWFLYAVGAGGFGAQLAAGTVALGGGSGVYDGWALGDGATAIAVPDDGTHTGFIALVWHPGDTVSVGPLTTGLRRSIAGGIESFAVEQLGLGQVFYSRTLTQTLEISADIAGNLSSTVLGPPVNTQGTAWLDPDISLGVACFAPHLSPPDAGGDNNGLAGNTFGIAPRIVVPADGDRTAAARRAFINAPLFNTRSPALVRLGAKSNVRPTIPLTLHLSASAEIQLRALAIPLRQRQRNDGLTVGAARVSAGKNAPTSIQRSSRVLGRNSYS